MKILSIDTSTKSCSAGLMIRAETVAELTTNTGQTHSKHILTMIDTVLTLSGVLSHELDAYAVTKGPGSFTGLRIGLSVVKGMAVVNQTPVVGVSSLDALAYQCGNGINTVYALVDARRKEVYFARYEKKNDQLTKVGEERVGSIALVLADVSGPSLFVGSGALLYRHHILDHCGPDAHFPPNSDHIIRASSVGYLGLKQMQDANSANQSENAANVTPNYIRPSDAELNKPKTRR